MGTYYRYVNYTRKEFVSLSDLREGGDKADAVLYCSRALAWLLLGTHAYGDGYRGRWASEQAAGDLAAGEAGDNVRIVGDYIDFGSMDETFLNITPGLLQSMREHIPEFVEDYHPVDHDVRLVQRVGSPLYKLADPVSASCKCGWKVGPIYGESREHVLELAVSAHVNDMDDQ